MRSFLFMFCNFVVVVYDRYVLMIFMILDLMGFIVKVVIILF